jgi:hypothetical protein
MDVKIYLKEFKTIIALGVWGFWRTTTEMVDIVALVFNKDKQYLSYACLHNWWL